MVRALVTGSTGFVGANLVAALNERNVEVIGLRRKNSPEDAIAGLKITPALGDVSDIDSLRNAMEGVDWVFQVAAVADYWRVPKETIYKVNVEGARNVMQAALDTGVKRLVLTSSSAALGIPSPNGRPMDETNQFNLTPEEFPYGHSKHLAEEEMKKLVDKGLHAVAVLPAAVIGPRDLKFNAGELIAQALKPTLPVVPVPNGGVNYIDVRDMVQGQIAAAEKGQAGERYLLAGNNLTHRETIQAVNRVLGTSLKTAQIPRWMLGPMGLLVDILKKMGVKLPIDRGRVMLSGQFMYYDNSKAVGELGLTVRAFEDSVRDTYQWYVENDYLKKHGLPLAPISQPAS